MVILSSTPKEGFFIVLVFIIIVIIIIYNVFFSKKALIKRKLKKTSIKAISSFNTGDIARIVGNVEIVNKPLYAPLSNRECGYYEIIVEKRRSSGKNSYWETIIKESGICKFVIKQGYQSAYIDTKKIKRYVVQDKEYSSGFLDDAGPKLEHFLSKHGYESENFLGFPKPLL